MLRPDEILVSTEDMYPEAWKWVDRFIQPRLPYELEWPSWCFLPHLAWSAVVTDGGTKTPHGDYLADVAKIEALGTWRLSKSIYQFAPSIYAAICNTVLNDDIPADVFYKLPEWSVYIETPGGKWYETEMHGFWCHLEWELTGRKELRLMLNTNGQLIPVAIKMGEWPLIESMSWAARNATMQGYRVGLAPPIPGNLVEKMTKQLYSMVSLVLYICSDGSEIDDLHQAGNAPKRLRPNQTEDGFKLFVAEQPTIWTVGQQTAEILQRELDGGTVLPAHWSGFWATQEGDKRNFVYKWVPTTLSKLKKERI